MSTSTGLTRSVWMNAEPRPSFSALARDDNADVCIVGAGLAGLTTAYLLAKAGKSVIVLEDGPLASGETERTTAHLSTVLDKRFFELERHQGIQRTRLAVESHAAAIDTVERIVREEHIACDFERVDGYLGPTAGQPADLLDRELTAARHAGLSRCEMVARAPFATFDGGRALLFRNQAQFHPLKYAAALARAVQNNGGRIFTHAHVTRICGGKSALVETRDGRSVACAAIVVATHTPANDRLVIHTKQAAYRTYAIALSVPEETVPNVLYWDTGDPYHYVRRARPPAGTAPAGHELLIVGGEDHKTGQADDAPARYARLEQWARARFPLAAEVRCRWSGQVMEPVDGLAYIGRNPVDQDNVYVATGFSGNGMTYGTVAGLLLTDLIVGDENRWAELYSPSRVTLTAANEFAKETANMAAQYADWLTAGDVEREHEVPCGAGAVVRHGFTKSAVYRDTEGVLHACSAVCPHLGGIVRWNHAEKTWDCPAHGSRFDRAGRVLNGPANKDLAPVAHEPPLARAAP